MECPAMSYPSGGGSSRPGGTEAMGGGGYPRQHWPFPDETNVGNQWKGFESGTATLAFSINSIYHFFHIVQTDCADLATRREQ